MATKKKQQLQSIPPEFGGVQSTTPELQFQQSFPKTGGGISTPKTGTTKDVTIPETTQKPVITAEKPFVPSAPPRVLRDRNTGRVSGIEIGGRTFFGINEEEARQIIEGQQRKFGAIEGAVEFERPETEQLRKQQQIQQQETMALINANPLLSESERLKLSGLAPFKLQNAEELANTKIGGAIGTLLGLTFKFGDAVPFKIGRDIKNALFGDYERTVINLQEDASDLVGSSRILLTAVRDGADANLMIKRMLELEAAIRQRYADAIRIIETNPDSIREGLDLIEDLIYDLTIIQERRFIMERYRLTRNPNELIAATSISFSPGETEQTILP